MHKPAMSDLAAQRAGSYSQTDLTFAALGGAIVQQNARRVSIVFCPQAVGNYVVSLFRSGTTSSGITVPAAGPPVMLTMIEHGAMVCAPWYLVAGTVPGTFSVIESDICECVTGS